MGRYQRISSDLKEQQAKNTFIFRNEFHRICLPLTFQPIMKNKHPLFQRIALFLSCLLLLLHTAFPQIVFPGLEVPGSNIASVCQHGDYLYAGNAELYRSADAGKTWEKTPFDFPANSLITSLISRKGQLYAAISGKVYTLSDNGEILHIVGTGLPGTGSIAGGNRLLTEPYIWLFQTADSIFAQRYTSYIASISSPVVTQLFRLTNQEKNWIEVKTDLREQAGTLLKFVDGNAIYAAGNTGLFRSLDEGRGWAPFDFPGYSIEYLHKSLLIARKDTRFWTSFDHGRTWSVLTLPLWVAGREANSTISGSGSNIILRYYASDKLSPSSPIVYGSSLSFSADLGKRWDFVAQGVSGGTFPSSLVQFPITSAGITGRHVIGGFQNFGGFSFGNQKRLFSPASFSESAISSAADMSHSPLAPESIGTLFGKNLSATTQAATSLPLPTSLSNVTVRVTDSAGAERQAPLFYVSPSQINFQIPAGTATGMATITVFNGTEKLTNANVVISPVMPGLFTANASGTGAAAALVVRLRADGSMSYESVAQMDTAQNLFVTRPIDFGAETDRLFLALFGTGLRQITGTDTVRVRIGETEVPVLYVGPQGKFVGLDQVNVELPRSLAGKGEMTIYLTAENIPANPVRISFQ